MNRREQYVFAIRLFECLKEVLIPESLWDEAERIFLEKVEKEF